MPGDRKCVMSRPDLVVFDFDGVFTDNKVYVDDTGREMVCCSREDSLGVSLLGKAGVPMLILSTERNPVVARRAEKMGIPVFLDCGDKALFLKEYIDRHGLITEGMVYMGNDVNDMEAMRLVGWPVCPADADTRVRRNARLVLSRCGGNGAVRELCDRILGAIGKS